MEIAFDEIMVGERGRAHDVLASSLPDEIARSLAQHLDLPGQLPPGFELESCVSGFPHAGRYVIARTSLDLRADRQGMVFSHALVADLGMIGELFDIAAVFALLKAARPQVPCASILMVDASDWQVRARPSPVLCDMLAIDSDFPVVIGDPLALEGVVGALWPRLFPALRRKIRFRLSFGPEESGIANIHIVAVPRVTVTRWPSARVLDLNHGPKMAESPAGRFLSGEPEGDLGAFIKELSIECSSFTTLRLASHALEISRAEPSFETTLAALRLIGNLQPDPGKGATLKSSLLEQLANRPGPRSVQDFLALRNFQLAPFPEKRKFIGKMTERFNCLFESGAGVDALSPIAAAVFDPTQSTEDWRSAGCIALTRLSSVAAVSVAPLVWRMLSERPNIGRFLLEQVANVESMDRAMAACLDEHSHTSGSGLSGSLIAVGFVQSESAILISRHDGELAKALKEACERDRHLYGDAAVKHIVGIMSPAVLLTAALTVNERIVTSAAAAEVALAPQLLAEFPISEPLLQQVWVEALKLKKGAWKIKPNVDTLRGEVFDTFMRNQLAPDLLEHLVSSPLGNALDYPRRADLWRMLPDRCRILCLSSTADAWAKSLPDRVSRSGYLDLERELGIALGSPTMAPKMRSALEHLAFQDVLRVFKGNDQLPETLFGHILEFFYRSKQLSGKELSGAARLVVDRDWRNLTCSFLKQHGMAENLRSFFQICARHLALWDRIKHGIVQRSNSELHDLLVETACELYPTGPMDSEIWVRAGGDLSQLDVSGTGLQQWHAAIRKTRKGNQVSATRLISLMYEDYPMNARLEYLSKELP